MQKKIKSSLQNTHNMKLPVCDRVKSMVPSPNGRCMVYNGGSRLVALDTFLEKVIWSSEDIRITDDARLVVSWKDDGPRAVVWIEGANVQMLFCDGPATRRIHFEGDYYCACFSADGRSLFLGGRDGGVAVWRIYDAFRTHTVVPVVVPLTQDSLHKHGSVITCMDVSRSREDGSGPLLVTGSLDGTVRAWDTQQGLCVRVLGAGGTVQSVRISANAGRIMACTEQWIVRAWERGSDTPKHEYTAEGPLKQLFMLPEVLEIVESDQFGFYRTIMGSRWRKRFCRPVDVDVFAMDNQSVWTANWCALKKFPVPVRRPAPESYWFADPDPNEVFVFTTTARLPVDSPFAKIFPTALREFATAYMNEGVKATERADLMRNIWVSQEPAREQAATLRSGLHMPPLWVHGDPPGFDMSDEDYDDMPPLSTGQRDDDMPDDGEYDGCEDMPTLDDMEGDDDDSKKE
jgi:hypothetical protein